MSDKQYKNILIEREGGITFLWLNRPDKRNAMSPDLHFDMDDALDWLATDKETEVLILGGKGEAWCAGQDLRLYFRGTQDNPEMRYQGNNASHNWRWERLSQFPKPTIAMVHGFAFGGAFTQLCACDFAVVAEDATFGLSEVNWGIISDRQCPKPTIAMVHGFAFGGAFTQLCACDFAVVAEDATFGLSEVNWGII